MSKKTLLIILGVVVAAVVGYTAYFNVSHSKTWFTNTKIGDVDVSNMTLEESKSALLDAVKNYTLTVKGRDKGQLTVKDSDVDMKITVKNDIEDLFKKEHSSITLPFSSHHSDSLYQVSFDEKKLQSIVNNATIVKGSYKYEIVAPRGPFIQYSEEKHQFVASSGIDGNTVKADELLKAAKAALSTVTAEIDISDKETYPKMYAVATDKTDVKTLEKRVPLYNEKALKFITWDMGNNLTETLDPQDLADMLVYNNGILTYDDTKVTDWTEAFALKYKTVGTKKTYKSHTGKTLSTTAGDYGWRLDWQKTLKQVREAIAKTNTSADIEAFINDGSDAHKAKLTQKLEPRWYSRGYKLDLANKANDWNTARYSEVDLTAQRVYVWKDGKVVFSCPCITGKPGKGLKSRTTVGAYYIKQKQYYRVLKGDDYETPVHWWARITWSGIGYHAAPWQSWGRWSPSYYRSRGSHGCVNLSTANSKKIYNLVAMNEMVFIHW